LAQRQDNSTLSRKVNLRLKALGELGAPPVVMETHGGYGHIWQRCYREIPRGVVLEIRAERAEILARQRPTWAVYQGDSVKALACGVGAHFKVNFLDCDPYGQPWPVITAFFSSKRPFPKRLALVVNDGLRSNLVLGAAWSVASLSDVVRRFGNGRIYRDYLEICRILVAEKAALAGYQIKRWAGYYCGDRQHQTHYAAILERESGARRLHKAQEGRGQVGR